MSTIAKMLYRKEHLHPRDSICKSLKCMICFVMLPIPPQCRVHVDMLKRQSHGYNTTRRDPRRIAHYLRGPAIVLECNEEARFQASATSSSVVGSVASSSGAVAVFDNALQQASNKISEITHNGNGRGDDGDDGGGGGGGDQPEPGDRGGWNQLLALSDVEKRVVTRLSCAGVFLLFLHFFVLRSSLIRKNKNRYTGFLKVFVVSILTLERMFFGVAAYLLQPTLKRIVMKSLDVTDIQPIKSSIDYSSRLLSFCYAVMLGSVYGNGTANLDNLMKALYAEMNNLHEAVVIAETVAPDHRHVTHSIYLAIHSYLNCFLDRDDLRSENINSKCSALGHSMVPRLREVLAKSRIPHNEKAVASIESCLRDAARVRASRISMQKSIVSAQHLYRMRFIALLQVLGLLFIPSNNDKVDRLLFGITAVGMVTVNTIMEDLVDRRQGEFCAKPKPIYQVLRDLEFRMRASGLEVPSNQDEDSEENYSYLIE
mmetsp:Transcript_15994/g.26227  ORF Transcript_15994/g.26227 Transcript_15994/m.26227 type:complete len:485 (+) Transcript_15994:24-1478(+)